MRLTPWVLIAIGCGGGDNHHGGPADAPAVMGTVKILNGASPGAAPHFAPIAAPAAPADGIWQITPNKVRLPLASIMFTGTGPMASGSKATLTNCTIQFDITQPGLAQSLDCPFAIDPGTYSNIDLELGATYDVLIDDPINNIYSDPSSPTKLSTTPPAGGAQFITVPSVSDSIARVAPFTVDASNPLTLSVLIGGLQFFYVTASGGSLALGVDGDGNPRGPAFVASVGTPAAASYYVNSVIGTPYSYNASAAGQGAYAVSVLYSNNMQPAFLGMPGGNGISGCGPVGPALLYPGGSYLGLDSNGVLGWATWSDPNMTMYSVELAMPQVSTLGGTTMLKCLNITADPMPPGGSFASGAPMIANPTYTTTMTLVAN